MELTAISTLGHTRDELLAGLGISANTLKTRVRQLLRVHQVDTFDALGKAVLRNAVDLAPLPESAHAAATSRARPAVSGLMPAQRLA
jgi:hypothetical protein